MKTLEKGSEKVKKICDAIKLETIEPALDEARSILSNAKKDANQLIEEAHKRAEEILHKAREQVAKERRIFEESLGQAIKQAIESLKQELEDRFFKPHIVKMVTSSFESKEVVGRLAEVVIEALKKEGLDADLEVIIPKGVPVKEMVSYLGSKIVSQFTEESVKQGLFNGGVQIRAVKDNLTVDITEQTLSELLAAYIRKDLRLLIFKNSQT